MSPTNGALSQRLAKAGRVIFHAPGALELENTKNVYIVGKLEEVRSAAAKVNAASVALLEDLEPDTSTLAGAKTETLVSATPSYCSACSIKEAHLQYNLPRTQRGQSRRCVCGRSRE